MTGLLQGDSNIVDTALKQFGGSHWFGKFQTTPHQKYTIWLRLNNPWHSRPDLQRKNLHSLCFVMRHYCWKTPRQIYRAKRLSRSKAMNTSHLVLGRRVPEFLRVCVWMLNKLLQRVPKKPLPTSGPTKSIQQPPKSGAEMLSDRGGCLLRGLGDRPHGGADGRWIQTRSMWLWIMAPRAPYIATRVG